MAQMILDGVGLNCSFPVAQISQLKHLQRLNLGNNQLTGRWVSPHL